MDDIKNILTGRSSEHLTLIGESSKYLIHKEAKAPFLRLQKEAEKAGFKLSVASAFRDYNRQLLIWNAKATGKRPLLDENENPISLEALTPQEIVRHILRWSALPGASRHHWGTDLDIFDENALPDPDYQVKLIPSEVNSGGPFAPMHDWLDEQVACNNSFGFFRPYTEDRGGVCPERWHISYAPRADIYFKTYSLPILMENISQSDIELKETLIEMAEEIFEHYVQNITRPGQVSYH